jgi:D-glycero-alpha-D-manno-heptose-7-phosphate kinase
MIFTRTPLRISLVGGGTDLPAFYNRSFGAVVSMAINQYVYVAVNPKFDHQTRVSYSKTENVHHPLELKHDIIRESLLTFNVSGVEVATVADIPGTGTGLGSSSALAVGLSKALYKYSNGSGLVNPRGFADHAYFVEREQCLHPVGRQDHYASAFGNLHYFQFEPDDVVIAELLNLDDNQRLELENRLVLLWTGRSRNASDILMAQEENMNTERRKLAEGMRDLAVQLRDDLRTGNFANIGAFLHANWTIKRQLAANISNEWIDHIYELAMAAGAEGGKICGAGGGGFFLFYGKFGLAPILEKATGLKHIPFKIDTEGCQVIYE